MPIMLSEMSSMTPERLANLSPRYPATIVVAPLVTCPDVDSSPYCAAVIPVSSLIAVSSTERNPEL